MRSKSYCLSWITSEGPRNYVSLKQCRDNRNTELTAVTLPSVLPSVRLGVYRRDRRRRNGYPLRLLPDWLTCGVAAAAVALVRNAIPEEPQTELCGVRVKLKLLCNTYVQDSQDFALRSGNIMSNATS